MGQSGPMQVEVSPTLFAEKKIRSSLTGSVQSLRVARLSPRIDGLVERINAEPGDMLEKGDILLQLDNRRAELSLEVIRLEKQRALITFADAERLVEEVRKLTESGGFSRSETESRITAANLARSQIELLETRERDQLDLLDRHQLPAPFAGIISNKFTEAGEWVAVGTEVAELIDHNALVFEVRAPQEMFASTTDGTEVTITLDAYPDVQLPAKIQRRVAAKDPISRTFLIRMEFEDPEGLAAYGMSGQASFVFLDQEKSIQVPRDAIVHQPDGSTKIWVAQRDDSGGFEARSVAVSPGASFDGGIAIEGDVTEGDLIVVRGNEVLREGQPITFSR